MNLDRIAFRTGLFIALLAKQEERAGVMISAGHHHKDSNVLKVVKSDGDILTPSEENFIEEFVHAEDLNAFLLDLDHPKRREALGITESIFTSSNADVAIGHDIHSTSNVLA